MLKNLRRRSNDYARRPAAAGRLNRTCVAGLGVLLVIAGAAMLVYRGDGANAKAAPPAALPPDLGTRPAGEDWPSFLGPRGDSRSLETGLIMPWPEQGPRIVWKRKLGTGYGAPTIARGRLYLFERIDNQATLFCLNSETGKELWKFSYPTDYEDYFGYNNGPRCCPVVDGDRVYIYGAEGMLHCLNAETGKLIWQVDTFKTFGVVQNFFGVGSTPVVEGDLLIAIVGGSPPESQNLGASNLDRVKGNGSGIVAFDKFTGEVRYSITDELASYASPMLTTIDGRRWCFAFARGGLVGFEPKSGKVEFQFPWRARLLESVNASNPVVVGNRVLLSETYGPGSVLLEVERGGCKVIWSDEKKGRNKSLQTHWNTAVYHEGYVYGSSGRHTNEAELRCVEFDTGKVTWSVPRLSRSSLLYVDGHFICLTEYGELLLFKANPEKFELVSQVLLRNKDAREIPGFGLPPLLRYPAWAAPVLSHGLLYVRGDDHLVCLEVIRADQGVARSEP